MPTGVFFTGPGLPRSLAAGFREGMRGSRSQSAS